MDKVAELLTQQPGPAADLSFILGPTQNRQLFGSLSKWVREIHQEEECVASKETTRQCHSVLVVGGAKCNNLYFP